MTKLDKPLRRELTIGEKSYTSRSRQKDSSLRKKAIARVRN
jgi:hypothetical protein